MLMDVEGAWVFLVIMYLDRLNRSPVQWVVYPRVKVWTTNLVRKLSDRDKTPNDDYGKNNSVIAIYDVMHLRGDTYASVIHLDGERWTCRRCCWSSRKRSRLQEDGLLQEEELEL
ncbi:hypothetical protein BVRB_7g165410 [Beta vulgaris subsp. vulgaris]|nr:hypothetical protein BVRB_7g165410 [Beta vulgaris subsp. vulgaris]